MEARGLKSLAAVPACNPSRSVFCMPIKTPLMSERWRRRWRESGVYLCASHDISPEFREYERVFHHGGQRLCRSADGQATWVELERARQHPHRDHAVERRLSCRLAMPASTPYAPCCRVPRAAWWARSKPRGPAVSRACWVRYGRHLDRCQPLRRPPRETTEASIAGFPIRIPMLDIHTVGAGGGSIARVDAGGLLRVGPESAGADPGPACYGTGTGPR